MSIPLQFASPSYGQEVLVWSDCLLNLGTDFSDFVQDLLDPFQAREWNMSEAFYHLLMKLCPRVFVVVVGTAGCHSV